MANPELPEASVSAQESAHSSQDRALTECRKPDQETSVDLPQTVYGLSADRNLALRAQLKPQLLCSGPSRTEPGDIPSEESARRAALAVSLIMADLGYRYPWVASP